jgi:hypothetical protein
MQLLDTEDMPKRDLLDVVIFVLSARCNNLKVLHLDLVFLHRNTFLPRALSQLLNVKQKGFPNAHDALTRLVKVQLDTTNLSWASWRQVDFPFSSYIPFLYLPSLETFSAPFSDHKNTRWSHPREQSPREWPTSTPPVFTLCKLDLCHTFVDPTALTFLLAQLPQLESLNYDLHRNCMLLLDCIELRHALVSVSRTLRELTISYDVLVTEAYEVADNFVNYQRIGSLRFLSRLTKLEITLPLLLGWRDTAGLRLVDALPGGLEDFCMRDDCTDYVHNMWQGEITIEEVRHWMEQRSKRNCTPNLKKFGFRVNNLESEQWTNLHHRMLRDICLAEGLQFWSTRQLHAEGWDLRDHSERTQCRIMGVGGYEYPKG